MTPERYQEVGRLYRAALEFEPARRAAYLAEACGDDEALRQEVAALLDYEARGERLLDRPALEAAAQAMAEDQAASPSLIGQSLGHYRILSLLGKGGMGEVWLAEDTLLKRQVAVKLLPSEFTAQPDRVRRFAQEARAASALNHPNIITIHEIGAAQTAAGATQYIVTEYVAGETLRERMNDAPEARVRLADALEMAAQIAAALAAAHAAGITHRDIKPENVMVRRDGIIKVLDFGLAKLTEAAPPVVDSQAATLAKYSTEAGVVMGTPRYMSPEQARGEKLDARTDIFSLGVMLYEMVAGRAPAGAGAGEVMAAILRDEPPSLADQTPPELERIVSRALAKSRAERYQSANDLLADLKQLQRDLEFVSEGKKRSGARGTEAVAVSNQQGGSASNGTLSADNPVATAPGTVPKRRRRAAVIALASILLIAAAGAWFYFHRQPVLTSKDTILLADFDNRTGDAVFDGVLKQGLAIQLQQSPLLNLFPDERVRQTLQLMDRPPDARVTAEIAREICERQGLKALIAGSIAPLGSRYVITLEAINAQNGETLAHEQAEAASREQLLQALAPAATRLREKLGESLSSIQKFNQPLNQSRTSKLEALKDDTKATGLAHQGRFAEAIPFLKRAVTIDPQFAAAHLRLAVLYNATGQPESAANYAEQAFLLRDRGSEFEKLDHTCWYHILVTGNQNKWLEALRLQKQAYPTFWPASNNLALAYNMVGQSEPAMAEAREAIRLNLNFAPPYRVLSLALLRLNRFAEAKETIRQAQQRKMVQTEYHLRLYQLAFIEGDTAEMQRQVEVMSGNPEEYATLDWQTGAAAFAGQWRKAQELSRRAIDLAAQFEMNELAARYGTEQALRGAAFGACRQARADAAQGLKLARGRASLPRAALALALCGEANQVKPLVADLTKRYPEDTVINSIWLPAIRAAIDLQRGDAAQAIEQLQTTTRYEAAAEFWPQYLRGQAYLKLGRGAEAAAEFQKILDHRGYAPLSVLYPLAHLELARAAALTGDAEKRRKAYEDFFALWRTADANLPILVEAQRTHLKP
ncbi:MAG: protein kinase [Acidobacteriota bacterium]|nr:protein kinase [Acidobacteriota bacterium]